MPSILNADASVPPRLYVKISPSASVADTAEPMSKPEPVFSSTERVVLSPSVNTGALFVVAASGSLVVTVPSAAGFSSTSVTLIVTLIVSVRLPSVTVMVTE